MRGPDRAGERDDAGASFPPRDARHPPPATPPRLTGADRLRAGGLAGIVAASATAGALVAFGARQGDAWRAFVVLGRLVLGGAPVGTQGARLSVALVGLAVHVVAVAAWGVVLGVLAAGARGARLAAAVFLVTLLAWSTNRVLAVGVLRPGHEMTAPAPQSAALFALYAVLALGLWLGMRVALPAYRLDERTR